MGKKERMDPNNLLKRKIKSRKQMHMVLLTKVVKRVNNLLMEIKIVLYNLFHILSNILHHGSEI